MWSIDKGTGMVRCAVGALGGGYWVVRCGAQALDARRLAWHDGRALDADSGLELKLHADDGTVQLEVTNTSPIPRTVDDLFLRFDHAALEAEDYLEYVHSKWLYEAQSAVKCVGLKTDFVAANPESSLVYLLNKQGSGTSFLFAALPPQQEDYVYFKALHLAPDLRGAFGVEIRSEQGRVLPPGASLRSSRILFDQGEDPLSLLENLGDRYAALRPRPLKSRPVGWNSWDEIGTKVTAPAIEDNQRIAGEAFGDKVRVYIIDDGWQKSWGDWRFTSTFLATGEEFCSRITAAGGVPGIWLAPLYADQSVMERHPEWFAKMPDGTLVESVNDRYTLGCLDITVPEVERHLFDLYRSLWTMGFRYFKVDFTQMVQRCTGFHDRTVGRGAIIRKTFEVIRRAVGDDSYVLACAPPYESVFGLVDAARITADIHSRWSVVQFNLGSAACRWWLDRKLWNNDPDFLIVRAPEYQRRPFAGTVTPFERGRYDSGRGFNAREARSWALAAVLLGDVVLSDDLRNLNSDGLKIIRRALELTPLARTAVPVDLFTCGHNQLPKIWVAKEPRRTILGIFNWDGERIKIRLALADYGITLDDERVSWFDHAPVEWPADGILVLELPPHASVCLVATPKKTPG